MISEVDRRLIEHVAHQRGYEFAQRLDEKTLWLSSSLAPGSIQVRGIAGGQLELQFELPGVAAEIRRERRIEALDHVVTSVETDLYQVLARAFSLSVALPDNPLHAYMQATAALPQTTDAERLVVRRVGQDIFRRALERYWQDACAITGISDRDLLRASHIKPWADSSDNERLDVYNGFLLAAHLDAAFDKHLVTISPAGGLVFSSQRLSLPAMELLRRGNLNEPIRLAPQHHVYLIHHRARFEALEAARS